MNQLKKGILSKEDSVDGKYSVQFFIKEGSHAETYRVKDNSGEICFLKLFNYAKLHRSQFDTEGNITEIEFLKRLNHSNLVSYRDNGDLIIGSQKFAYLVLDFISGETLSEKMKREYTLSVFEARQVALGVLNGLKYLHNLSNPIIHNEITNQNVMLDLSAQSSVPVIIDFGYARSFHQSAKAFNKDGLNPFYLAPECFNNIYSPQSDLYSVGALLYHLIFGLPPWYKEISDYKSDRIKIEDLILEERKKPLKQVNLNREKPANIDEQLFGIIEKALHPNVDVRFKMADEFIKTLSGEITIDDSGQESFQQKKTHSFSKKEFSPKQTDKGFDQIAGMEELKETLYNDVIRALEERELYEEYGLTIPNGMLLYGPPGCGKTFFAQKLAEEVGFYFSLVKPSDLASIYVHGSQEKIGQLFNEARENAPAIIFIDELDALVPSRNSDLSHSYAEGVNEFLAQMTNCSEDGIFIIGATNRPDKIDPAILRTGRIDKTFYIPPPDFKARKALFQLYLKTRPIDLGIDYDQLAELTEQFVSSDIEFLINEAARTALKNKSKISQEILESVIKNGRPSVHAKELNKYVRMRSILEGDELEESEQPSIGFKTSND